MPSLELRTSEGIVLDLTLAGAGSRFAAALLDASAFVLLLLLGSIGLALASRFGLGGLSDLVLELVLLAAPLVFALAQGLWQHLAGGATPGKKLLGLRVVAEDGRGADLRAQLLRSLAWIVDCVPLPVPVGLMLATAHPKRQRLGDLLAGTLVVRVEPVDTREPWARESWSGLDSRTLPLTLGAMARLEAADLTLLRSLILRTGLDPHARERLIHAMARHYAERLELEPRGDARRALQEIYLCLREARGAHPAD